MSCASKRQRLIEHKVLCQKDYLSTISSFLTIKNILRILSSLSVFHYNFINNIRQSKVILQCIEYDFGKNYLHLLNIRINFIDNNHDNQLQRNVNGETISVSSQLCPLYTDWSFIYQTAIKSPSIDYSGNNDNLIFDFSLLLTFESFKVFKYWYNTVKL